MSNTAKTILVIEDDLDQREIYKTVLQRAGFTVVARGDALSGLRWLEQILPDLILLDYMLPNISGAEMLARIRQTPNGRYVPVVVATAVADLHRDTFSAYNISAFLQKPLTPDELTHAIHKALKGSEPA